MENNNNKNNNINNHEYLRITSKNNNGVVEAFKLNEKKYREEYGKYIAEGKKLLEEAILYNTENILEVYILEKLLEEENIRKLIENLKEKNNDSKIIIVTEEIIAKISKQKNPEGIIIILKKYEEKKIEDVKKISGNEKYNVRYIPVFENISDPNNLGAILRVASSLGLKEIITIGEENVDRYSPKVLRSSMGGFFKVDIIKSDIFELKNILEKNSEKDNLENYKNSEKTYEIIYTDMQGENLYQFSESLKKEIKEKECKKEEKEKFKNDKKETKNILIIFGNEANGVSDIVKENIKKAITIPMETTTESLNLATSVAIILYELNRVTRY